MKKQDLTSGMIAELRDGNKYNILANYKSFDDCIHPLRFECIGSRGISYDDDYSHDLLHCNDSKFDIVKIYSRSGSNLFGESRDDTGKLLWKRKEIKDDKCNELSDIPNFVDGWQARLACIDTDRLVRHLQACKDTLIDYRGTCKLNGNYRCCHLCKSSDVAYGTDLNNCKICPFHIFVDSRCTNFAENQFNSDLTMKINRDPKWVSYRIRSLTRWISKIDEELNSRPQC